MYDAFAALVERVDEIGMEGQRCLDTNNYLGDSACSLRFAWDMTVALGDFFTRAAVPVVEALVKRSLTFLTAFLDTALWAKDAVDQAEQVLGGTRQLSIAAAGPTTVPPTTVPIDWHNRSYRGFQCGGTPEAPLVANLQNGLARGWSGETVPHSAATTTLPSPESSQVTSPPTGDRRP